MTAPRHHAGWVMLGHSDGRCHGGKGVRHATQAAVASTRALAYGGSPAQAADRIRIHGLHTYAAASHGFSRALRSSHGCGIRFEGLSPAPTFAMRAKAVRGAQPQ